MAIGTAIKKMPEMKTETDSLLTQAIIRDRDTFFDGAHFLGERRLERT